MKKKNKWVVTDMNRDRVIINVEMGGEEDEPPPDSNNSLCNRFYRVVHGIKAHLSLDTRGEDINLYTGLGRRTIGMDRAVEFPVSSRL